MISVIITAFKEPKTIKKAIESVLEQKVGEVLVVAPDEETLAEARKVKSNKIKIVKDSGEGKPSALNLAVKKAKGEILVLTDGDVYISKDSINELIKVMKNKDIGAVSGRPISINDKNNRYGFWAYVLTSVADELRMNSIKKGKNFFCSGYLFSIRKSLFPKLPKELLSEDGYISYKVSSKGKKVSYSKKSEVYVKYPDNFSDWIKQKRRSAGGYNQIRKITGGNLRSFGSESMSGFRILKYAKTFRERLWIVELVIARVYMWGKIYLDINLKKKSQKEIWERVESTK